MALAPRAWPLLAGPTQRFWDSVADAWDGRAAPDRTAPLEAALGELPVPPRRVLEIGSGTGDGTRVIAETLPGAEVVGTDISPEMVRAASAKLAAEFGERVRIERGDAAGLSHPDASFDLVAQLNVPAFTAEIARVLAPGGHAIFASTLGDRTPYHTPHRLLRRLLAGRGLETVATGTAGRGTFLVARRPAA